MDWVRAAAVWALLWGALAGGCQKAPDSGKATSTATTRGANEARPGAGKVYPPGHIEVAGTVLDKRTGAGLANIRVHFIGAPPDDGVTGPDGRFAMIAARERLHQGLLIFPAASYPPGPPMITFSLRGRIDPDAARHLVFHVAPEEGATQAQKVVAVLEAGRSPPTPPLKWQADGKGILCNRVNCVLCGTATTEKATTGAAGAARPSEEKAYPAGHIDVAGTVLDKHTGARLANIRLHFVGASYCDAVTGPDGRFATLAARARFDQCMLTLPAPSDSDAPTIAFHLPSDIDPDTARHLEFHVAPEDGVTLAQRVAALSETGQPPPTRPLEWRADGKGILCNRVNCALCENVATEETPSGAANEARPGAGRSYPPGHIDVAGTVLNKHTGAGLANVRVHFVGAPGYDAATAPNGRFATIAPRTRFDQCTLVFPAPGGSAVPMIDFLLPNDIDLDSARHLVFHVAPEDASTGRGRPTRPLEWRADGKGILCNRVNCVLCGTVAAEEPATGDQKPPATYESDLQAFFAEIDNTYPFFDLKGIRNDWAAAKRTLLPHVQACRSDEEFLQIVLDATKCLRDAHMGIRSARVPVPPPAPRYYPQISFLPAEANAVVISHLPPGREQGLYPGAIVKTIDGVNARAYLERRAQEAWAAGGRGFSSPQRARMYEYRLPLRGAKGDRHTLVCLCDQAEREITLTCDTEAVGWPHGYNLPANLTRVGRSFRYGKLAGGVGYMYLRRVDASVVQGMREALRTYPDAPGWIVDLCGNGGGGYGPELIELIKSLPRPVAGLIDAGCTSAGETLARDLVLQAQARLFGSRTAGASSAKRTWRFPSGIAEMILPVRSRYGLDSTPIEYHGISPHEEVEVNPEQMRQGVNSSIARAEQYILRHRRTLARP